MTNPNMTLQQVKDNLQPRGESSIVGLTVGSLYLDKELIDGCVQDLAKMEVRKALGQPVSSLEKLGAFVILRAAGAA